MSKQNRELESTPEFENFRRMTKYLLNVPKNEVDAERAKYLQAKKKKRKK